VAEVAEQIHKAGGIAVLACRGGSSRYLVHEFGEADIGKAIEAAIGVLEVYHRWNDEAKQELYTRVGRRQSLLVSGGSDSHGVEADGEDEEIGSDCCEWEPVKAKVCGRAWWAKCTGTEPGICATWPGRRWLCWATGIKDVLRP
jgi:hypothetical protein